MYFSVAHLINSETVKERIHYFLIETIGDGVTYKDAELHLFPFPEIVFHQVHISKIYAKAEGSIAALRVYPDIWALIKGKTGIAKINLEAPHFSVRISSEEDKPTLKEIEEKVRSVVQTIVSTMPGLKVEIKDGRFDLTESDKIVFSFDMIQSRLNASKKKLDIEVTSRSNLWDNFSLSSSLEAEDLKSKGIVRITRLHPDILFAHFLKNTAGQIGVVSADLVVKFETVELGVVNASMESSIKGLEIIRHKKRLLLGDASLLGDISVGLDAVTVRIKEAKITQPSLNLSGQYSFDYNSKIMTVDLAAKSIDAQPLRRSALAIGGDIPLIKTIFSYVQSGQIQAFAFHTDGKSQNELGSAGKIRISGKMTGGTLFVKAKELTFHDVSGDVVVSRGVLEANNIGASIRNCQCSLGTVRIGLSEQSPPFHLDMRVRADLSQLPSLLREKQLITNTPLLHEMARLHDIRGSAEGRLILGERLHALHIEITVDAVNLTTLYEPVPFPVAVTGGHLEFDEKILEVTNLEGSIGGSSFSGLTGSLGLNSPYDLKIAGGRLWVSTGEIYPWITSFEKIRPALDVVRSVKGEVEISLMDLHGPLYEAGKWQFRATGLARELILDTSFLPWIAEGVNGAFGITQDELSLKDIRTKLSDSLLTVRGAISSFPANIRNIDISFKGDIGPRVNLWAADLLNLPPEIKLRAPFFVRNASLVWEKDIRTEIGGLLLFGTGTQVSFRAMKTADTTAIRDLTVKDNSSNFAADFVIERETIDASFKGKATSETLNTIFKESMFSGASLEGDFRTHLIIDHPEKTAFEGSLKGNHIAIPWGRDIPLVVQHIVLEAREQGVFISSAALEAGDMKFNAKGTVSRRPSWFDVDMDISANGIQWSTVETIIKGKDHAATGKESRFLKDFPVRGTLRLRSDLFQYSHTRWEPFHADVSFDSKTVLITLKEAELCRISTTGTVVISEPGLKLDVALSARDLSFRPTILCFTNANADLTGTFEMEARLKGEGKVDEMIDWIEGTYTLSAKEGKIFKARHLEKTLDLLNESENFKGQFPHLDKEIIRYKALQVRGTVRKHRLQIEEGILDSSVIEVIASGHVDLHDETLDITALVAPIKTVNKIVGMIPVLGSVLGGALVSVPVRVSGDIRAPRMTFLSPSAIGSEVLGIVTRILKLPVKLAEPIFPAKHETK